MAVVNIQDVNVHKVEKGIGCPVCNTSMLKKESGKQILRTLWSLFKPNQPVIVYYCNSCKKEHVLI